MSYGLPQYRFQTVPASAAAQVGTTGARKLQKVVLTAGSGAAAIVEFKNAATDTGTVLLTVAATQGTTQEIDLCEVGGLAFGTAIFCKPAGTGAIAHVWYD
jgi:hypothetical protein